LDISKDWDINARNWSDSISAGHDRINDLFGMPVFINNVGNIDNLKVLDAGCGEGRSSRNLAKSVAIVKGVDISSAMIDAAIRKENELPLGINYFHSSCENLLYFDNESFDVVT
jgi:2-polyprenyl-3-methyl-5-hydroxy-6-metoxy-1,4-benzoquinol methylase